MLENNTQNKYDVIIDDAAIRRKKIAFSFNYSCHLFHVIVLVVCAEKKNQLFNGWQFNEMIRYSEWRNEQLTSHSFRYLNNNDRRLDQTPLKLMALFWLFTLKKAFNFAFAVLKTEI